MAEQRGRYRGPTTWPIAEHVKAKSGSGAEWGSYVLWNLLHGDLCVEAERGFEKIERGEVMDEGDRRALAALANYPEARAELTAAITAQKKKEYAAALRNRPEIAKGREDLKHLIARSHELGEKLKRRPLPKPASTELHEVIAEVVERSRVRGDRIRRFEAMQPEARRRLVYNALDAMAAGDRNSEEYLRDLDSEREILDPVLQPRIETELQRRGKPQDFAELERLLGRIGPDNQRDGLTGIIPVASLTLELFEKFLDEQAGITQTEQAERQAAEVVKAADHDGAITLTEEQAKNPQIFRAARDSGKEIQIEGGDEGHR